MAKNQINFSKMTEVAHNQLNTFKESAYAIAEEDLRFKAEMKPLKAKLDAILANRDNDMKQGMSVDEVVVKFPRTEIDNEIRKAETNHQVIVEPLNKAMKDSYVFVPENIFTAYTLKINDGKRGEFLKAITEFLSNLGIEGCSQGQISKFAESMSDKLGAKYATSKKIVEDGTLVTAMKKNQFNKLFMAVFCEMYIK
ncbi:hypothetical protein DWZ63_10500 [Clostridium sp. AF34-13]|uniref:hypothetical protein n=1 Tax=Clostridium sp. AF34-13 TaxID=2293012 RepID=UPI000E4BA84F|nr:hypothetical protein [Clostridium sp. AF34-13]RHP24375.1 hypothetical protein DWZ63_10500 [Clostridium sp. AF34-13]